MLKHFLLITLLLPLLLVNNTNYTLQRNSLIPDVLTCYSARITKLVKNNPHQLSVKEYTIIAQSLLKKAPCNVLVFGVGNDSSLWIDLNKNGKVVFLEDNEEWLSKIKKNVPGIKAHLVHYKHKRKDWSKLLTKIRDYANFIKVPAEILTTKWDILFVDAPEGWSDEKPGRMSSIFLASLLAQKNKNTEVFVHDCDREVEAVYTNEFLKDKNLKETIGRLRHYTF